MTLGNAAAARESISPFPNGINGSSAPNTTVERSMAVTGNERDRRIKSDAWYLHRESARGGLPTFTNTVANGQVAPISGRSPSWAATGTFDQATVGGEAD